MNLMVDKLIYPEHFDLIQLGLIQQKATTVGSFTENVI